MSNHGNLGLTVAAFCAWLLAGTRQILNFVKSDKREKKEERKEEESLLKKEGESTYFGSATVQLYY